MASNDAQGYNIAAIRELLLAAFTSETLHRFCLDRPLFQPVVAEFGAGQGLADMIDQVIDYCRTQLLFEDLLAEVSRFNPRQYARFEPDLRVAAPVPRRRSPSGQPQPALVRSRLPYWIGGAVALVVLLSLGIWLGGRLSTPVGPTPSPTASPTSMPTPSATPSPTGIPIPSPTPSSSDVPVPTDTATPAPRPRADLIVDSISFAPSPPIAEQSVRVRVQVRNQGAAASSEFYLIWWAEREIASAPSCQWTVAGGLSPGGTVVMECDYVYTRYGPLNSRAAADTGNAVPEEDEENNILDTVVGVAVVRHLFTLPPAPTLYDENPGAIVQETVKDLAEGWKFSDDFLTLTMYLRQGVTLVDGLPFVAGEVKKKWDEIPGWANPGYVEEIVVVDDRTIQFIMWQYDSIVLDTLADFEFVTMN